MSSTTIISGQQKFFILKKLGGSSFYASYKLGELSAKLFDDD